MEGKISKSEIDRLSRKLMRTSGKVKREVAKDLAEGALNIRNEAIERVNVDFNRLRSSIGINKRRNNGLLWSVGTDVKYAPYHEFGTGKKVDLTHLVRAGYPTSYARQFKGKGVKQVNIQPTPFLFPSLNNEIPKLKKRVRKTLAKNGRNF